MSFSNTIRKNALESAINDLSVNIATNPDDAKELYSNNSYDIVLIDHAEDGVIDCVNNILSINKNQRVLAVSNTPKCLASSCEVCERDFNIRRLSNPTSINNIIRVVSNFDNTKCNHYGMC